MGNTRQRLVSNLADGEFCSGESLGEKLGLSRAAIWKQIQILQSEGLAIESVHGKGYRLLTRVELLDSTVILSKLPVAIQKQINISHFEELDSTNSYLMQLKDDKLPHLCLAEKQTIGRGRRGRAWQTSYGTSLAMSLKWLFNADASRLAGLSLAIGVVIAQCLEDVGVPKINLKWPNDLLLNNAKLGGILIELSGDASGPCVIVIGVGLNICNSETEQSEMQSIDQPWVDLASVMPESLPSRNCLVANLITAMIEMLTQFEQQGFELYRGAFEKRDALLHRQVDVFQPAESYTGFASGVNEQGALLVQVGDIVKIVNAGEVSVRAC